MACSHRADSILPVYEGNFLTRTIFQARLEGLGNKLMCGETKRIGVLLRNAGPQPLKNLLVSLSPPDAQCVALPVGSKPPQSPLTNLGQQQQGYR